MILIPIFLIWKLMGPNHAILVSGIDRAHLILRMLIIRSGMIFYDLFQTCSIYVVTMIIAQMTSWNYSPALFATLVLTISYVALEGK